MKPLRETLRNLDPILQEKRSLYQGDVTDNEGLKDHS